MNNKQIFIKTIIWRFVATLITFFVAWAVSGNLAFGTTIGGIDAFLKLIGYFIYEKLWNRKYNENTK